MAELKKKIGNHLTIVGPHDYSPASIEIEISNVDIDGTDLSLLEVVELYNHLGEVIKEMGKLVAQQTVSNP